MYHILGGHHRICSYGACSRCRREKRVLHVGGMLLLNQVGLGVAGPGKKARGGSFNGRAQVTRRSQRSLRTTASSGRGGGSSTAIRRCTPFCCLPGRNPTGSRDRPNTLPQRIDCDSTSTTSFTRHHRICIQAVVDLVRCLTVSFTQFFCNPQRDNPGGRSARTRGRSVQQTFLVALRVSSARAESQRNSIGTNSTAL